MRRGRAFAKINLALVVGPLRDDGKHELVSVLQKIDLADDIELETADSLSVGGFEDTLVTAALVALAEAAGTEPRWRVRIEKRIPVAAGLGGGSADAATALLLANSDLPEPLSRHELHSVACRIGADVPFFLREGPQLATGDGTVLEPIDLPDDYFLVLLLPEGQSKRSTEDVYRAFDGRNGADGFGERRSALLRALAGIERSRGLAALPRNDLASSPGAARLEGSGAFRADVSGAGPAIYGLFERWDDAERAASALRTAGPTWLTRPA